MELDRNIAIFKLKEWFVFKFMVNRLILHVFQASFVFNMIFTFFENR